MAKNQFKCDCNAVNHASVCRARANMPEDESINKLSDFYKMIGDVTRCKILLSLMTGEMCVCDLANSLSMTKSSISHQLNNMLKRGIVKRRRNGKEVYYSLDDEHVSDVIATSLVHIKHKSEELK